MKKKKIGMGIILFSTFVICLFFLNTSGLVTNAYAGACQYCKWNDGQYYSCAVYDGPGYNLCHVSPNGQNCQGRSDCGIPQ